jgi:hypothetical protein
LLGSEVAPVAQFAFLFVRQIVVVV